MSDASRILDAARAALWATLTSEQQAALIEHGYGDSPTEQALASVSATRKLLTPDGARQRGEITARFELQKSESGSRTLTAQLSAEAQEQLVRALGAIVRRWAAIAAAAVAGFEWLTWYLKP
jgi:hypothetical protein